MTKRTYLTKHNPLEKVVAETGFANNLVKALRKGAETGAIKSGKKGTAEVIANNLAKGLANTLAKGLADNIRQGAKKDVSEIIAENLIDNLVNNPTSKFADNLATAIREDLEAGMKEADMKANKLTEEAKQAITAEFEADIKASIEAGKLTTRADSVAESIASVKATSKAIKVGQGVREAFGLDSTDDLKGDSFDDFGDVDDLDESDDSEEFKGFNDLEIDLENELESFDSVIGSIEAKSKRANAPRPVLDSSPSSRPPSMAIDTRLYDKLEVLGLVGDASMPYKSMSHNVGTSNYAEHLIQPWNIWIEYQHEISVFDLDIVKRCLRTKAGEELLKYQKIKHICEERIRQVKLEQGL